MYVCFELLFSVVNTKYIGLFRRYVGLFYRFIALCSKEISSVRVFGVVVHFCKSSGLFGISFL